MKAAIAALNFILTSSSKYNTDDLILSNELQQLGLPKGKTENTFKYESTAIHLPNLTKTTKKNFARFLSENHCNVTFLLNIELIKKVTGIDAIEWRVDYLISSSFVQVTFLSTFLMNRNLIHQLFI